MAHQLARWPISYQNKEQVYIFFLWFPDISKARDKSVDSYHFVLEIFSSTKQLQRTMLEPHQMAYNNTSFVDKTVRELN